MAKFMKNINLISRSAELYREERLRPYGISGCQSKYILAVANAPGVSQEELSRRLFVNKSNVARQITLLEGAGFIRKEINANDRRSALLFPTQKLTDILPKVKEVLGEWRHIVTEGFSEEEKELLHKLTCRMVDNASRFMEGRL